MINQITRMRLPDGSEVAFVDWGDIPLFSTAFMLDGFTDAEVNFFTYLVGETTSATSNCTNVPTATELETNVATAAAMAGTEEMLIYSVKPEYYLGVATGEDSNDIGGGSYLTGFQQPLLSMPIMAALHRQLLLRLEVSDKIYVEAGLGYFNTGFGPFGPIAGTTEGGVVGYATAGLPSQEAVRSFAMPTYIGGTEKYRVFLSQFADACTFAVATADDSVAYEAIAGGFVKLRIYLEGLYKRPVS
jgi:hypothetical protein